MGRSTQLLKKKNKIFKGLFVRGRFGIFVGVRRAWPTSFRYADRNWQDKQKNEEKSKHFLKGWAWQF